MIIYKVFSFDVDIYLEQSRGEAGVYNLLRK